MSSTREVGSRFGHDRGAGGPPIRIYTIRDAALIALGNTLIPSTTTAGFGNRRTAFEAGMCCLLFVPPCGFLSWVFANLWLPVGGLFRI